MSQITSLTPNVAVRILRPLAGEAEQAFRRRMEAMVVALNAYTPGTTVVFLVCSAGAPSCVVAQPMGAGL